MKLYIYKRQARLDLHWNLLKTDKISPYSSYEMIFKRAPHEVFLKKKKTFPHKSQPSCKKTKFSSFGMQVTHIFFFIFVINNEISYFWKSINIFVIVLLICPINMIPYLFEEKNWVCDLKYSRYFQYPLGKGFDIFTIFLVCFVVLLFSCNFFRTYFQASFRRRFPRFYSTVKPLLGNTPVSGTPRLMNVFSRSQFFPFA